jgi:hypothetical protein
MSVILAVAIRVRPGCILHGHGRSWHTGQVLEVALDDAARLVRRGVVERVRADGAGLRDRRRPPGVPGRQPRGVGPDRRRRRASAGTLRSATSTSLSAPGRTQHGQEVRPRDAPRDEPRGAATGRLRAGRVPAARGRARPPVADDPVTGVAGLSLSGRPVPRVGVRALEELAGHGLVARRRDSTCRRSAGNGLATPAPSRPRRCSPPSIPPTGRSGRARSMPGCDGVSWSGSPGTTWISRAACFTSGAAGTPSRASRAEVASGPPQGAGSRGAP